MQLSTEPPPCIAPFFYTIPHHAHLTVSKTSKREYCRCRMKEWTLIVIPVYLSLCYSPSTSFDHMRNSTALHTQHSFTLLISNSQLASAAASPSLKPDLLGRCCSLGSWSTMKLQIRRWELIPSCCIHSFNPWSCKNPTRLIFSVQELVSIVVVMQARSQQLAIEINLELMARFPAARHYHFI